MVAFRNGLEVTQEKEVKEQSWVAFNVVAADNKKGKDQTIGRLVVSFYVMHAKAHKVPALICQQNPALNYT